MPVLGRGKSSTLFLRLRAACGSSETSVLPMPQLTPNRIMAFMGVVATASNFLISGGLNILAGFAARCRRMIDLLGFLNSGPNRIGLSINSES